MSSEPPDLPDKRSTANRRAHYNYDGTPKTPMKKGTAKACARQHRKQTGKLIKAYQCPLCNCWHIGQDHRRGQ